MNIHRFIRDTDVQAVPQKKGWYMIIEEGFPNKVLNQAVIEHMTPLEMLHGAVYLFGSVLHEGAKMFFARLMIENPWDEAALVYVDCERQEDCDRLRRFMLVNLETGSVRSYRTMQCPFSSAKASPWEIFIKAPAQSERNGHSGSDFDGS